MQTKPLTFDQVKTLLAPLVRHEYRNHASNDQEIGWFKPGCSTERASAYSGINATLWVMDVSTNRSMETENFSQDQIRQLMKCGVHGRNTQDKHHEIPGTSTGLSLAGVMREFNAMME